MQQGEYQNMFELETSHWWYKILHKLVERYISKTPRDDSYTILDAGCGTGRMMEILQKYCQVEGFDFSPLAVTLAKTRGLRDVYIQDLVYWDNPHAKYNVIVSLDVINSIDDDHPVLKKFYESLKPGGVLILNLPAFEGLRRGHDVVVNIKRRYTKENLLKVLQAMGFKIETTSYRLIHLYLFIYLRKFFSRGNGDAKSDLGKSPNWINNLLEKAGRVENRLLLNGIKFPAGSSIFVIAKK